MSEQRKRMVVIDGKSVFYRGYYAMPNLAMSDGTPTGGVFGFAVMALEVIKKLKPDFVAVAWDKPKTNIRKRLEMYPAYKAGRKPAPPDFYAQVPILHELLEAFGWPLYELDDYEADDIMAGLSRLAKDQGIETVLISGDMDLLQTIDDHVRVYFLKKGGLSNIEPLDPEGFKAKHGIDVHQFIDLKALKGDSSDNIPGVPGIGEKGAVDLLQKYQTLNGIYENLALLPTKMAQKLEAGKESAYLSKKLVTLMYDAPIPLDLKTMDIARLDAAKLQDELRRLEFRSLLKQLPESMQVSQEVQAQHAHASELVTGKIHVLKSASHLKLEADVPLVLHTRCSGKHGREPQVLIVSSGMAETFVLDIKKISKEDREHLQKVLNGRKIICFDTKADLKCLAELGIVGLQVEHDIVVGAFLINALLRNSTLSDIARDAFGYEGDDFESIPTEDLEHRAAEFTAVIRKLYEHQKAELKKLPKVQALADEIEWPVIAVLADMERSGMELDVAYLKKMSAELADLISDIEQQIYGMANQEFNISSPSQLAEVLYVKLALPTTGVKKGKTGYSTAANELDRLRPLHPIIDLITNYREYTKLKSTYVDTLPEQVDEKSRLHTTFNLTTAQTGRLSSLDPNLQNIPVRTELGRKIRTAFVAGKGKVLVSADYSQFELRVAAALSGDEGMIDSFNNDRDIHIETAALINGVKPEEVTKSMRYAAKAVNFGIMYGQGPHGLAQGTGMDFTTARQFIAKYFEIRPKLKAYIDELRRQAKDEGYVESLVGRRRPTPDVQSSNFAVREGAFRAAINMPVQGTAADLTKLAMVRVVKQLPEGAQLIMQVHDSLLIECETAQAEEVSKILKETMEAVYPKLGVKLKVDVSTGQNWGEL